MEFRVLGSIEAVEDGRRLPVAPGRQTGLLAFLLIHADRVVSADRILDALWGDDPPETGAKTVAFHVSRLRDALEPGRQRGAPGGTLVTEPSGYVLRTGPDRVDAVRFERLAAEGRTLLAEEPVAARSRLDEALALWRGTPYADVADEPFAQPEIRRLDELRLGALEDRAEADLALGRHTDVIVGLEALVEQEPLRERPRAQLMVALYREGRQAEALRVYNDGRRLLAEELGVDPGPELRQIEAWILSQDPRLEATPRSRTIRNPYKGLRPFEEEDSADFFGREALVSRLVARLGDVARADGLLAVVGPSGSGKSSVVRAGLVPALRSGALPGATGWLVAAMQPGAHPLRELTAALRTVGAGVTPVPVPDPARASAQDGGTADPFTLALPDGASRLVLVVDQLEELWSLTEQGPERDGFVALLVGILAARDGRLLVVATLRADHLDRPLGLPGLGELIRAGTELVTPLTRDELERAIARPAAAVGVRLEPGLAAEVIADVARQPGELPLLQYALTELFDRGDGQQLTRDGYAAIGGVLGALARRADDVHRALDPGNQEIARQVFLRLVAVGESGDATARRVARADLRAVADDGRRVDEVLDAFGRGRLLAFDRDAVTGEPVVSIAHEALLNRWPRLAGWVEGARTDLRTRRQLAEAAAEWIRARQDPGFLLSGSRLDHLAAWATATDLRLDPAERGLLDASLAERDRGVAVDRARVAHERVLERRATTRLRALVTVLALAVVVTVAASIALYGQGEAAREQGAVAIARELAGASIGSLDADPRLSLLLAWHAADTTADRGYIAEEAMDALHWALQSAHVRYPDEVAPIAVRSAPDGLRGVVLLPPARLMGLALSAAGRDLTPEECRAYLHRETCPPPAAPAPPAPARVYAGKGAVPLEQLAGGSLAGTRVTAVSEMPVDAAPLTAAYETATGIEVAWVTGEDAGLSTATAPGALPDVAIVSRPALVAQLGRQGILVDLDGIAGDAALRAAGGDYLAGLGTVAPDGDWPAAEGALLGIPFAVEAESLVWYPRSAFERAGYAVPGTWDDLVALEQRMIADGQTPWCLGVMDTSATAVGFVEEVALRAFGLEQHDQWVRYGPFAAGGVRRGFAELGRRAFEDGYVAGGLRSAMQTPRNLAAWPMFTEPPGCWLHLAGGAARRFWPASRADTLAAFPFPAFDAGPADVLRGRVFMVIAFHDRPEVRRLVADLMAAPVDPAAAATLEAAGIRPVSTMLDPGQPGGATLPEDAILERALRAGTFRVSASDLMPASRAEAFERGTSQYLTWGPISLPQVIADIERSREEAP